MADPLDTSSLASVPEISSFLSLPSTDPSAARASSSSPLAHKPSPVRRPSVRARHQITLGGILSGRTSAPHGLKDLERYLLETESIENLHFVVWLKSYYDRFHALPADVRHDVQVPPILIGDRWSGAPNLRRAWEKSRGLSSQEVSSDTSDPDRGRGRPATFSLLQSSTPYNSQPNSRKNSFAPAGLSRPPTLVDPLEPLRKEINRITSTFLRPGSSKELNLDERSRDRVLRNLTESVHPDGCLPAYEEAWMSLQNSMDHFLTAATENTPRRRQFWLALGIIELLLSLAIFLLTLFLLPPQPFGWRAVRLASTIFAWSGSTTVYIVLRGHLVSFSRNKQRNLNPWKLEEGDEVFAFDDFLPSTNDSVDNSRTIAPQSGGRSTRPKVHKTADGQVLEDEVFPWPFYLWGKSPRPLRTWKRGHLPPPFLALLEKASDNVSSILTLRDYSYKPATAEPPAVDAESQQEPVRTWKRGHVPPSKSASAPTVSPTVRFASLPSPGRSDPAPLPAVQQQVFSTAFILDDTPPPIRVWKRGQIPSSLPPLRRSSKANIAPDWDRVFDAPASPVVHTSGRRVSQRSRPSLAGPVAFYTARRFVHLRKRVAIEVALVGLCYALVWIALCLAVPGVKKS